MSMFPNHSFIFIIPDLGKETKQYPYKELIDYWTATGMDSFCIDIQ